MLSGIIIIVIIIIIIIIIITGFVFTLGRGTPHWIDPTGVCAWLVLTTRVQTVW